EGGTEASTAEWGEGPKEARDSGSTSPGCPCPVSGSGFPSCPSIPGKSVSADGPTGLQIRNERGFAGRPVLRAGHNRPGPSIPKPAGSADPDPPASDLSNIPWLPPGSLLSAGSSPEEILRGPGNRILRADC